MQPPDRVKRPPIYWPRRALATLALLSCLLLALSGAPSAHARMAKLPGTLIVLRAGPPGPISRVGPPRSIRPSGAAPASANFIVSYTGFSTEAQAAFQAAVDIWSSQISSPVPIRVSASWTALDPGVLGSAGAVNYLRNFTGAPQANTWYPIALANQLAGSDLDPSGVDIEANFSSVFPNWYYGTDGNTPAGDYDLMSVVLHELGHGLGFAGSGAYNTNTGSGSWGLGTQFPLIYDRFVENGSGQVLLNTTLFPNPSLALGGQLTGGDLFFNGTSTLAAAGGTAKLYAPASWEQGSSYSHLDEDTFPAGDANSLMTPQFGQGESVHNPGAIVLGMFKDMGWSMVSEPPPDLPPQMYLPITVN